MSHGGAGGGGGHDGGYGGHDGGYGGHHGSIQGSNIDPNWVGTLAAAPDDDWRGRWFDRLTPGKIGGFFFLGFALWLFVVYGASHQKGDKSKLADLKDFPSNKYEYSIRAASGQQAWEREPTKLLEHLPVNNENHSARLFSNLPPDSYSPTSAMVSGRPAPAVLPTMRGVAAPEDLLSTEGSVPMRPYNAAFGSARTDIPPPDNVHAIVPLNLPETFRQSIAVPKGAAPEGEPETADLQIRPALNLLFPQPRVDLDNAPGQIAQGRSGALFDSYPPVAPAASDKPLLPRSAATRALSSPSPYAHTLTQATSEGVVRTRLVVNR